MSDTAQCSKCGYKIELPHADMIQIFYKDHNCDSTKLQEAIQRVRELHIPILYGFSTEYNCSHCRSECVDYSSDTPYVPYPCPTIKALDGEQ